MIAKQERKRLSKNQKKLKEELKTKGHVVRGHCSNEEIERLVGEYRIELTCKVEVIEKAWLGKPKGLLQVLWERGRLTNKMLTNIH